MLLSVNWLKDYLAKTNPNIHADKLADSLTMLGFPVENIKTSASGFDKVVVGKILKIEKHPGADRLQVTQVATSEDPNSPTLQIVCGAKNIAEGDIVPVALVGAVLPGDFKIKESVIRGVASSGMICSGKELDLSDDTDGILQLPKHSALGQPLTHLLGSSDSILDIDVTPNRPDCLSMIGLAREIAPVLDTRIREPKAMRFKITPHRTSSIIDLHVEDPRLCPRYVARVIDSLKVTESPDWIKERIKSIGLRPINNIVDITNFVMFEYGQPLHAFDLTKIDSGSLTIGPAKHEMDFELLNGETAKILPGDILILDGHKPVALAGIMGGANSEVTEDTTSIILESAIFDAAQIRKTAKRLKLSTEASKRFERGVDIRNVLTASDRASALFIDTFKANVYHPPIDTNDSPQTETSISLDMREVRRLTGLEELSTEKAAEVLESIDVPAQRKSTNILIVKVPSHRLDLRQSVDLVEEIARLIGYDKIPKRYPVSDCCYDDFNETKFEISSKAKTLLSHLGLRETIHYSFTSQEWLLKTGLYREGLLTLQNPISEDLKIMRPSLLGSLLESYLFNRNRKSINQRLFEVAKIYLPDASKETTANEIQYASGLLSGKQQMAHWIKNETPVDFYFVKGLVEQFLKQLGGHSFIFEAQGDNQVFHPNRSAIVKVGNEKVGILGEIHPHLQRNILETTEAICLFEIDIDYFRKQNKSTVIFQVPSKFPPVECDIAFVVDKAIGHDVLTSTIRQAGSDLLSYVELFDLYEGENIPVGKKSVAFHLGFLSPERTLNEQEITDLRSKITGALSDKHGAKIRE